ncbi:gluconokinase [Microlunatus soli]|uniref:Gluconokinase n=1 Tax=Microlunatus soli TaxID=630515 RepID=A0A1H1VXR2_9ACTN|nr:gluconokinase [Microlunatus soli]SDS89778.1 gluconate kinase, SKI family [Microlunatus soli]
MTESGTASAPKTALVVMGVAGSGKTTVAELLAEQLGWQEAEADDFHPEANVAKMHDGIPLTDEDRAPWLEILREWIDTQPGSVVLTCSALKRSYRDVLRSAKADVKFLHLDGDPELIRERMSGRRGHFMPLSLLDSQLATLEPLQPGEPGVVLDVDQAPEEIVAAAVRELGLGV